MLSAKTVAHGRSVACALLGVDALYRAESGDQVGLVVLNMATGGGLQSEAFDGYGDAMARWRDLESEARGLPEPDRRLYYEQVARSTRAFIRWRTEGLDFRDQLTGFLHVPAAPAPDRELLELRRAMGQLLDGLGIGGDMAAQCARWEASQRVAPEDVQAELSALLDQAWNRTCERLMPIPAPKDDGMQVATVSGAPFNARCDYLARTVEINTDPVLTRPGLKHLAVHEGCPGHYVQFKLRETLHARGEAAADVLLSVVNTAGSSVFEGIADTGMAMLGWVEDDHDRLQSLMNRYRAGIGTAAAWRLHARGWPATEVERWLREASLAGGEGWVTNRMAFISAPSRAALIWSYWWGERSVWPAWTAVAPPDRAAFLAYLYGRLHSTDTVGMFDTESGA